MTRLDRYSLMAGLLVLALGQPALPAAGAGASPNFPEVYRLIKEHATGVTDAELNRAAVEGLLAALGPKASWVTNSLSTNAPAETPLVTKASLFEGPIAYLRVAQAGGGLAKELKSAYDRLDSTNTLVGVVLDLRYAEGDDYAAAAAAADWFTSRGEPLLNWGTGIVSSHEKTNAIGVPVVVLVNHETAGAAEALAAMLREVGAGLVLGGRTAGQAMVLKDFPLSAGGQLRIAVAPVTLGNGSPLPAQGINPDITVAVNPEDERAYYGNPFAVLPKTSALGAARPSSANPADETNLVSRHPRLNEAELVREHKEGLDRDLDLEAPRRLPEPAKLLVNDPGLSRALDLLKGLALVRQSRF
jgi:hypothetical protein